MNDLFLRKVELSNFRVYGNSYTFNFPPSPGVTLIIGANGLGKTTFFDGIEWALTNEVSRFAEIPTDGRRRERDPLTRLGLPEGSHRVSLQFTDGPPIDRGRGVAPADGQVADLLRKPQWPGIGDLHRYLSITHFLGQASSQRFSVRKPRDQWEALKGPAGVDRINYIKDRIGGQAARQAFTRAIREATDRVSAGEADLASWKELLGDRDRLDQLSASDEAVPADAVAAAANEIGQRLAEVTPDVRWTDATSMEGAESVLNRLAALTAAATDRSQTELARLQTLETLVADYVKSGAEATATTALVTENETRQHRRKAHSLKLIKPSLRLPPHWRPLSGPPVRRSPGWVLSPGPSSPPGSSQRLAKTFALWMRQLPRLSKRYARWNNAGRILISLSPQLWRWSIADG
jgi:hypothetical protein